MENETRVTKTEEVIVFQPSGTLGKVYRVTFFVGEHGPFTVDLKQVDFVPERIKQEVERVAATIRALG